MRKFLQSLHFCRLKWRKNLVTQLGFPFVVALQLWPKLISLLSNKSNMCLQLSHKYANFASYHFQSSCLQITISPLTANIYSPLLGPPFLRNALQILISAVTGRTAAILLRLFHCKNCQKTQTQSVFYSSIWFIQYVATGILCNCKRRTIIGFLSKNYLILHTSHSVELIFDLRCGSEDKRGLLIKNQDGGNWGKNTIPL